MPVNHPESIIYEQPLNELMRVCLRLEHLFEKVRHYLQASSAWDARECLQSILEVVSIADRPELKTHLHKELSRHYNYLHGLNQMHGVDSQRLSKVLTELQDIISSLNESQGKLAGALRQNEFLNAIRLQLTNIGGACNINTPLLHYWLHQHESTRLNLLEQWFTTLKPIQRIVGTLLQLIRTSSTASSKEALDGFFEMALNPKQSLQLLRIELKSDLKIYPEISSGRHRVCIRFLQPCFEGKNLAVEDAVNFKLTLCVL